jgi:hypothetical protein
LQRAINCVQEFCKEGKLKILECAEKTKIAVFKKGGKLSKNKHGDREQRKEK